MAVSAQTILNGAFDLINVKSQGETLSNADAQDGLRRLNNLVNSLITQQLAAPFVQREVFSVTAFQNTYTMGPGGQFNTTRPPALTGAGLLLNSSTPPVEIPRGLFTDDAYEAIAIKDLQALLWTGVYFNATFSGDLATVFLWPTPTTSLNSCVLYRRQFVAEFADLTTEYDFPPGYREMLEYNVAQRMLVPYGVKEPSVIQGVNQGAVMSMAAIKRQNYKLSDLQVDPAFTHDRRGGYNILTGTGG